MRFRSVLFTPGDAEDRLQSAIDSSADAAIFDLEDGVADSKKSAARDAVREAIATATGEVVVGVRINPLSEQGYTDLEALSNTDPAFVILPKVEAPGQPDALSEAMSELGLDCPIRASIETADGVLNAPSIAAADHVAAMGFGGEDLTAILNAARRPGLPELEYARQRVIVAAGAAGIPVQDTIYPEIADQEGLRTEARIARRLGMDGKTAIHPDQIPIINEVFTPSKADINQAKKIVTAYEDTDGGAIRVGERMVDEPVYERSKVMIKRAQLADEH